MKKYVYLVLNKTNGNQYTMIGNLKNENVGSGRYLYQFVSDGYQYAKKSPYGLISNMTCGMKYNSEQYRVLHQTVVGEV